LMTLQRELDSRVPELDNIQRAKVKGLLLDGFRIQVIKELREWFPEMGLKQAKDAMEEYERNFGFAKRPSSVNLAKDGDH
jgi:ribosomal protein L7/L12